MRARFGYHIATHRRLRKKSDYLWRILMETALAGGRPRINFLVHQITAGIVGAGEDFQQMVALLVRETFGDGRMIFANPED